jgi:L,D-transpeptidase YbiS
VVLAILALLLTGAVFLATLVTVGTVLSLRGAAGLAAAREPGAPTDQAGMEARNKALAKKLAAFAPKTPYLVIDTARNRLFYKKGEMVVREAIVSTGSGVVLKEPNGKRSWTFDTPRGEHVVKSKATNPMWIKPDWAFIEEGEPLPSNYGDRVEEGTLGDYALGIGNGYFLHGTLYTRLLGRNVTHGCVRIGDEDLEFLFRNVPLGTKVYIF